MQCITKTKQDPSRSLISYGERTEDQGKPLIIDFSPLLNYKSQLIINQWGAGIIWKLETKYSTKYSKYVDEAIAPLSFIVAQNGGKQWYLMIPKNIRTALLPYSSNEFSILYLTSHYSEAYQLFISHPTLFWMLLFVAKNEGMSEEEFLRIIKKPRTEIMAYCDLPETKSAIKLLRKIKFKQFNSSSVQLIKSLFSLKYYAHLNHHQCIDEKVIRIVCRYPVLIKTRFIHHFESKNEKVHSTLHFINDTVQLASTLHITNILRLIGQCRSYRELNAVHDKLVADVLSKNHSDEMNIIYPDPPMQGNDHIIPITNQRGLFNEAVSQHHCVMIYHKEILEGSYYVYKVLLPERATLGLRIKSGQKPRIDQLVLDQNGIVSPETKLMVERWLNKLPIEERKT